MCSEVLLMGFDQFTFGKRFKELRKERKLTQEQLADRLGISEAHLQKQEVLIQQLKESIELAIFVLNLVSQNN